MRGSTPLWQGIGKLADDRGEYRKMPFYFFDVKGHDDGTHWVVGRHRDMLTLIDDAWAKRSKGARDFLEGKVRLGFRSSDVIATPEDSQQNLEKSSANRTGDPNHRSLHATKKLEHYADKERVTDPARIKRQGAPAFIRAKWQRQNKYWNSFHTPNSHHIVEGNVLELLKICPGTQAPSAPSYSQSLTTAHTAIGYYQHLAKADFVSFRNGGGELDYAQLPAMMLAAEFHSRYFNPLLLRARAQAEAGNWREVCKEYKKFYKDQSRSFEPLCAISKIILRLAFEKANVRVNHFEDLF